MCPGSSVPQGALDPEHIEGDLRSPSMLFLGLTIVNTSAPFFQREIFPRLFQEFQGVYKGILIVKQETLSREKGFRVRKSERDRIKRRKGPSGRGNEIQRPSKNKKQNVELFICCINLFVCCGGCCKVRRYVHHVFWCVLANHFAGTYAGDRGIDGQKIFLTSIKVEFFTNDHMGITESLQTWQGPEVYAPHPGRVLDWPLRCCTCLRPFRCVMNEF